MVLTQRLRTELRDLTELVLLPGLAAVLPWRWCFPVFRHMAHWRWLYRAQCDEALTLAHQFGVAGNDEAHWIWVRRLVTLVDHADHYLGLSRSDAWMHKHLVVDGAWPQDPRGALLVTFHWGAGYWGLRHAVAHGLHPHALMAPLSTTAYAGRSVMLRYARSRNDHVERVLQASAIDVAVQLKNLALALRDGHPLLGVVDVPADDAKTALPISLLGLPAQVAGGLLRRAADQRLPVTIYITGLDTGTGQRHLRIRRLGVVPDIGELSRQVFAELDAALARDPPAWHFWSIAPRVFGTAPPTAEC